MTSLALVLIPAHVPPLPTEEPHEAHLTVVYGGDEDNMTSAAHLRQHAVIFAKIYQAFGASIMGTGMFGDNSDEPVLLIQQTGEIMSMRSTVARFSRSTHAEFRPHVAVPKLLSTRHKVPRTLYFNRVGLWWGDEHHSWWLGSGEQVW